MRPFSDGLRNVFMKIKNHKHLFALFFFGFGTLVFYLWFINSPYFSGFLAWSQQNLILYYAVLLSIKIIGIVWPPIPGGLLTLGSIPVLGWPLAYSADFFGSMIGSTTAYFLARKYGLDFMKKIFDEDTIEKLKRVRIKPRREIESIFLFRIFGGTIIEVICYGAGLLKVRFRNYLIAITLSHIALGVPAFYLTRNILAGRGILINLSLFGFAVLLFYKLKHRYFEYG